MKVPNNEGDGLNQSQMDRNENQLIDKRTEEFDGTSIIKSSDPENRPQDAESSSSNEETKEDRENQTPQEQNNTEKGKEERSQDDQSAKPQGAIQEGQQTPKDGQEEEGKVDNVHQHGQGEQLDSREETLRDGQMIHEERKEEEPQETIQEEPQTPKGEPEETLRDCEVRLPLLRDIEVRISAENQPTPARQQGPNPQNEARMFAENQATEVLPQVQNAADNQANNHQEDQAPIERVILNQQPEVNSDNANPVNNRNPRENQFDELKNNLILFGKNMIRISLDFLKKYGVFIFLFVVMATLAILMANILRPETCINCEPDFKPTDPLQIELKELHSDLYHMPECSEKNLLRLIFYTKLRTLNNTQLLDDLDAPSLDNLDVKIENEIQLLKENLKKEELDSEAKQNSLMKIQEKIKNAKWAQASDELKYLLKTIRPLNTNEMYRLIEKALEAAEEIKGKDIILFIGRSGSGKSTTIHLLGGSEMARIEEEGKEHIAPIKINNPALKRVFTSSESLSVTKYITPVTVNLEEVDKQLNGSMTLTDTPGFGDTSGTEVDIANGVGIIKALQGSRSVKPVIVISFQSLGDKLELLKDLVKTVAGVISDVKHNKDSFFYFWTKFSEKEKKQIHPKLVDMKRTLNMNEDSNKNVIDLIDDMIEKTENGIITINPISDKPGVLLKMLQDSPAILEPGKAFIYSITQDSEFVIMQQVDKFQTSIKISIDRFDFSLALYKLDEMRNLSQVLQSNEINTKYTYSVNYCIQKLNGVYNASITNFNKCFIEKNTLGIEDIEQYKELFESVKKAGDINNAHLGSKVITTKDLLQNVQQETKKLLSSLKNRRLNETSVSIILDKLKLLSTHFPEVRTAYDEGCQRVNNTINDTSLAFQRYVETDQFEKSTNEMQMITQTKSILKDHVSSTYLEKTYQDLRKFLYNSLNNCTEGPSSVFAEDILDNNDVSALKTCLARIEVANKTQSLKKHISTKNMNELHSTLFEKLLDHSKEVDSKMTIYFKQEHENSLKKLEQLMMEMGYILTVPSMDSEIAQTYHTTLGKLEKVLRESKAQIEHILSLIPEKKHAVIPEATPEPEAELEPVLEPEAKVEEKTEQNEIESNSTLETSEANESSLDQRELEIEAEDIILEENKENPKEPINPEVIVLDKNPDATQEIEEPTGRGFLFYFLVSVGIILIILVFIGCLSSR